MLGGGLPGTIPASFPLIQFADMSAPAAASQHFQMVETTGFADYALIDSGAGRKLERFGAVVVDRPEPQALWQPRLKPSEWAKANAVFSASGEDEEKGKWRIDRPVPDSWPVRVPVSRGAAAGSTPDAVTMLCRMQGLWHLGLFPEQLPHWAWMLDRIAAVKGETPRVLNLFGYTGAASLLAAAAGADVTHIDASKKAIAWARDNQTASKLEAAKIRWIVDDAAKFVARDVRRGKTYHLILVDPPKFGRGPEGEVWDLFTSLPPFLQDCRQLLAPQQASMILTVYAIRASVLAFDQLMREVLTARTGTFQSGELAIRSASGNAVPTSLFTRWISAP
jgi:23S rRNA (cytosine1962-C5)-methyltransferase